MKKLLLFIKKQSKKAVAVFRVFATRGGIESVLDFVQNDLYYPDFVSKLTYLVFRFCSGHFFNDGNKRIALTLGTYRILYIMREFRKKYLSLPRITRHKNSK